MLGKNLVALIICVVLLAGCGFSNIINRGEYIDQKSVVVGAPRKDLLSRFGAPIDTKIEPSGITTDIFRVPQGESTAGKVIKGGGLLIVDIFTLGLSEAIATPVTEGKNYVMFEVKYDKDERVQEFKILE
ncbi:MAG: hypothetical protein ACREOW_15970 [Thermodesulfobacteriota bacterium]